MNKPEQLRLAADIIEKNLPWEVRVDPSDYWRSSNMLDIVDSANAVGRYGYEIRLAPPPPQPVPLTAEDVPPGSVIRSAPGHWFMVVDLLDTGVKINGREGEINWHELDILWEIKRPGQDWQPCSKPV